MGSLPFSDRAARTAWRIVPKRALSGAIGWGASRELPAWARGALLSRFARAYGIDVQEAEKPLSEYTGFGEFFTRRLRVGARPVDATPGTVVSPADGTIVETGVVTAGHLIQAKGVPFRLDQLLADADAARRLEDGCYVITYLSPRDYHRVHAPVSGAVVAWHHVPGTLFSVGAKSIGREPGLFTRNERFVTLIEGPAGLAAVIMVAAVGVGHITAAYDSDVATHHPTFVRAAVRHRQYEVPRPVGKGDELGTFHLGSTTIAVFQPGRVALEVSTSAGRTRMGEAIGRILSAGNGAA